MQINSFAVFTVISKKKKENTVGVINYVPQIINKNIKKQRL
jgi:hypothetical protein